MVFKMATINNKYVHIAYISSRKFYFVPSMIFSAYLYERNMYVIESLLHFDI